MDGLCRYYNNNNSDSFFFVFKNKKTVSVNATVPDKLPEDSQPEKKVTIQPTESYVKLSEKEASEVIDALKKYMQEQQAYLT